MEPEMHCVEVYDILYPADGRIDCAYVNFAWQHVKACQDCKSEFRNPNPPQQSAEDLKTKFPAVPRQPRRLPFTAKELLDMPVLTDTQKYFAEMYRRKRNFVSEHAQNFWRQVSRAAQTDQFLRIN